MAERSDVMTSDGLPRLGPTLGLCNLLPSPEALVRCEKPEGHHGPHFGRCGWGPHTWEQDEPRRLIPAAPPEGASNQSSVGMTREPETPQEALAIAREVAASHRGAKCVACGDKAPCDCDEAGDL